MSMAKIKIPVILGPTAVGKSDLALSLATEFGCEILSCDSRQIYQELNIGTAKPTQEEMQTVPHWMIDIVPPTESFSAHRFESEALQIIRERAGKGKRTIICGGTGLYYKSLSEGMGPQIATDLPFRKKYTEIAQEKGREAVHEELQHCDPETAKHLHPNDLQRVIRALQVFHDSGIPLSTLKSNKRPPSDIAFEVFILQLPRDLLYTRINNRVDTMMDMDLWQEFTSLYEKGYTRDDPGMHCVGYKELYPVIEKKMSLQQAITLIKQNTRNFAKRQITWFRNKVTGTTIDMTRGQGSTLLMKKVKELYT